MRWFRNSVREWVARYQTQDWHPVTFGPVLALFIFGAALRLAISPAAPPPFEAIAGEHFYDVWLTMGLLCPVGFYASWQLINRGGRKRVFGLGLRLASDLGMLTVLLSCQVTVTQLIPVSETRLFSRYMIAAVMVFTLELILRDVIAISVVERQFRRHRHGR